MQYVIDDTLLDEIKEFIETSGIDYNYRDTKDLLLKISNLTPSDKKIIYCSDKP